LGEGQKPSFAFLGACRVANGGLSCEGSVSAAEAHDGKTDGDGVHCNCRIIHAANSLPAQRLVYPKAFTMR
jgi:hypothetical protein